MTDHIEKSIVLKAPLEKVWQAISDSAQFGSWFGMKLDGPFVPGQPITGAMAPTTVNAEIAKMQEPYAGKPVLLRVEAIEPMTRFAFGWHPYAIDPNTDYSSEPMTLVTFLLSETEGGTRLVLTETGFENLPAHRRDEAFRMNDGGWTAQMGLIEAYCAR
ncbi:MAG: SRPBCC family protein [Asticcacaulis sp.]|nr:SRPBCC family protein [Asticcacaulis sp.]